MPPPSERAASGAVGALPTQPLRALLLITDLGFIAYWATSALHLLPEAWLFKDHDNPILVAWNWSFLPVDLLASVLGLAALLMAGRGRPAWRSVALISLAFTLCAGLMAVAFWALRADFELAWWLPNLFLAVWPLFFLKSLSSVSPTDP